MGDGECVLDLWSSYATCIIATGCSDGLARAQALGQPPYAAGNGDYAIYYSANYAANYAAIIPIIPPFFFKRGGFFLI